MEEFIKAIGAISEAAALCYTQLVKHGVPPQQAATLPGAIIAKAMKGKSTGKN